MFKITAEPGYAVYYEKVGDYKLLTGHAKTELAGCMQVRAVGSADAALTSREADRLIQDLTRQFERRAIKLPFDRFEAVKVQWGTLHYLCATEQGQEALEKHPRVRFTSATTACTLNGPGWLLPADGAELRKYLLGQDLRDVAELRRFLASLYPKQEQWILPK